MTEPRMRVRPKGQQFATADLEAYLIAFGDSTTFPKDYTAPPLPATVVLLDEIVTDFIIETCHAAAVCAAYSHRAKIKVDDFKFALRKDSKKLGRVTELLALDKDIKRKRKAFEVEDVPAAEGREGEAGKKRRGRRKVVRVVEGEEEKGLAVHRGEKSGRGREKAKRGRSQASQS